MKWQINRVLGNVDPYFFFYSVLIKSRWWDSRRIRQTVDNDWTCVSLILPSLIWIKYFFYSPRPSKPPRKCRWLAWNPSLVKYRGCCWSLASPFLSTLCPSTSVTWQRHVISSCVMHRLGMMGIENGGGLVLFHISGTNMSSWSVNRLPSSNNLSGLY